MRRVTCSDSCARWPETSHSAIAGCSMQGRLTGSLGCGSRRLLSASASRVPCVHAQWHFRPQQNHKYATSASSIAQTQSASEAPADPFHAALLHQYWEARGVFSEADRTRIVEQTLGALQDGDWEGWAPLPQERLPGLPAAWNMANGTQEEVLEVSWRLLQLSQLLGGGVHVQSLVFMVLREPQLLRTPSQELMRRLLEMRVATADWDVDVIQLVVRQPALLTNASWGDTSALAALSAAQAAATATATNNNTKSSSSNTSSSSHMGAATDSSQQGGGGPAGRSLREGRVPGAIQLNSTNEEDMMLLIGNDWGSYHSISSHAASMPPAITADEHSGPQATTSMAGLHSRGSIQTATGAGMQHAKASPTHAFHSSNSSSAASSGSGQRSSNGRSSSLEPAEQLTAAVKAKIITSQVASTPLESTTHYNTGSNNSHSNGAHSSNNSSSNGNGNSHSSSSSASSAAYSTSSNSTAFVGHHSSANNGAGPAPAMGQQGHGSSGITVEEAPIHSLLRAWEHGLGADGDIEWTARLQQLREYVSEHGDASVGFRDELGAEQALGRWAAKQRADARKGQLPDHRRAALDSLGFQFNEDEAEWVRWFTALQQFKEASGHCSPWPLAQGVDLRLINWASIQRQARRAHVLPDDRIMRLDKLGFDWTGADPLS